MKSVLRSVKPYWFYLMCEGIKKIEVSKTEPLSKEWNDIVYLYCSKDKKSFDRIPEEHREKYRKYLGTVGASFYCYGIMDISSDYAPLGSCLTSEELMQYGKGKNFLVCVSTKLMFTKIREPCPNSKRPKSGVTWLLNTIIVLHLLMVMWAGNRLNAHRRVGSMWRRSNENREKK